MVNSYEDKVAVFLSLSRARIASLGQHAATLFFRDKPYDEQTSVAKRLLDINEALDGISDLTGEEKLVLISAGSRLGGINEADWPGVHLPGDPGGGVIIIDMGVEIIDLVFNTTTRVLTLLTKKGGIDTNYTALIPGTGGGDMIDLSAQGPIPITLGGFPVGDAGIYTPDDFGNKLLRPFLAPSFSSFGISGQALSIEVGESIAAGLKSFVWSTVNGQNIAVNSIIIRNITQAINYLTAQPNDGVQAYNLASAIAFLTPRSETIQISGVTTATPPTTFTRTSVISSFYKWFYGPVATAANDSATVRALPMNRLTDQGNVFILDTGNIHKIFQVWARAGKTLSLVTDLDALNATITDQYVPSSLSVNDAAGTPVAGTLYTYQQAINYGSSHRHELHFTG